MALGCTDQLSTAIEPDSGGLLLTSVVVGRDFVAVYRVLAVHVAERPRPVVVREPFDRDESLIRLNERSFLDALADGGVDALLTRALDRGVLLPREVARDDEQLGDRVGNRRQPVHAVELVRGHLLLGLRFDRVDVQPVCRQRPEEVVVELDEHLVALHVVGDVLVVRDVVDRLAAAGGVADHRRRPGRGDRRRVVVTDRVAVGPVVCGLARVVFEPLAVADRVGVLRLRPVGEDAALLGELVRGVLRAVVDMSHQLLGNLVARPGAVLDTELDVQLCEAHDPESDLPHLPDLLLYLRHREVRHRHDVLEEARPPLDAVVERVPVDGLLQERRDGLGLARVLVGVALGPHPPVGALVGGERREVDVAEVAGLVLLQGLLAAVVDHEPVRDERTRLRFGQVVDGLVAVVLDGLDGCLEPLAVRSTVVVRELLVKRIRLRVEQEPDLVREPDEVALRDHEVVVGLPFVRSRSTVAVGHLLQPGFVTLPVDFAVDTEVEEELLDLLEETGARTRQSNRDARLDVPLYATIRAEQCAKEPASHLLAPTHDGVRNLQLLLNESGLVGVLVESRRANPLFDGLRATVVVAPSDLVRVDLVVRVPIRCTNDVVHIACEVLGDLGVLVVEAEDRTFFTVFEMAVADHPAEDTTFLSRAVLAERTLPVLDVDGVARVQVPCFDPSVVGHDAVVCGQAKPVSLLRFELVDVLFAGLVDATRFRERVFAQSTVDDDVARDALLVQLLGGDEPILSTDEAVTGDAGVGRENLVFRMLLDVERVRFVDAFEVDEPGFAVLVGALDDVGPELLGGHRQHLAHLDVLAETVHVVQLLRLRRNDVWLARPGIGEGERLTRLQRLHELVRDADGDVEVREVSLDGVAEVFRHLPVLVDQFAGLLERRRERGVGVVVGVVQPQRVRERDVLVLRVDELDHVRVRDAHDAHLGATARAALGDCLAHLVVGPHERDGAGGDAAGRADGVAVGPQPPEGVAHPAAALEHLCRLLCRLVDVVDVVRRRVDETGRELLELVAGVHQRRRVRHEREAAPSCPGTRRPSPRRGRERLRAGPGPRCRRRTC